MKRSLVIIILICSFITTNAQSDIDVLHYRFHIGVNDDNDTVHGKAEITVMFLKDAPSLVFDLVNVRPSGKGMKLGKVNGPSIRGIAKEASAFTIHFLQPFRKGDTATFIIPYEGIPVDGLIISKNKYGHRTFFADNWPNRGHNWLPCNDDPADKASVEFIVTAPGHYQVVSNGIQVEETNLPGNKKITHWREDVPISTKVMVIGVADFAVNLAGIIDNCIPVYSWVYPEDRDHGFYDYAQATEILPFFIKNVGPYAYKKLANVQSKTTFGGLENANTIFYSESSVGGRRRSEALIAHEIAHQWFGNMATEKSFAHLWLSEGFATYMTILYMESKYGPDTALHLLKQDRSEVIAFAKKSNRPVVDHTKDYMELLNANSYQKGGWILHMLRSQLGDSVFWNGIRTYYATFAGKTADTEDLRRVLEAVSGKDLERFFTQWLYSPGIPVLDLSWKYNQGEGSIIITVTQRKGNYEFPLEILVQESRDKMPKRYTKTVNSSTATFTIPVKSKPLRVEVDPMTTLLYEGSIKEN